jgi:hypothetical protein
MGVARMGYQAFIATATPLVLVKSMASIDSEEMP